MYVRVCVCMCVCVCARARAGVGAVNHIYSFTSVNHGAAPVTQTTIMCVGSGAVGKTRDVCYNCDL
jgi:hypothetical protein